MAGPSVIRLQPDRRVRRTSPGVTVERREVDDPDAWRALVRILADLILAPNPDEPRQR